MTRRSRRLWLAGACLLGFGSATALTLDAFSANIVFFMAPSQILAAPPAPGRTVRLGGMVVAGSLHETRVPGLAPTVRFAVTDGQQAVPVRYVGVLPDLFREGQSVVALGEMAPDGSFRADEVLAKHDETYMPKEVAAALRRSGRWDPRFGPPPDARSWNTMTVSNAPTERTERDRAVSLSLLPSALLGPELGRLALALACCLALAQAVLPLWGAQRGDGRLMATAPALAGAQLGCLLLSFLCLAVAAVGDDFSVANIAANSAVAKPLLYKITGIWGNHEGSILLWALILGACGGAVAWWGRALPSTLHARVLGVLGGTACGFELFCLLTSNPFDRAWPAPVDGQGMNPLLQDPGLAVHPPILYAGYVGFAVPFAFAVAALLEGRVDAAWGRWVRPWAVAAWCFLTGGIALGSWWSYYVLGWGGYWFWDPVENASLLPWLTGTALVHSAIVVEKREALKVWTVLLAIATFSLSLSGTFLVRSGILNSVHAFANDPARGVFILGLLGAVIGGALLLFAVRAPTLTAGGVFAPLSREGALVLNNILLCAICAVVLTGTMYPPFASLLFGQAISVGKPFFDATAVPMALPLLAAMAIGPMTPWKRARLAPVIRRLWGAALLAALAGLLASRGASGVLPALAFALGVWVIAASAVDLIHRTQLFRLPAGMSLHRARMLPRAVFGAALAHAGAGVSVIGLAGMSQASHAIVSVHTGDSVMLAGDRWTLQRLDDQVGPNYRARVATVAVTRNGRPVAMLHPARRDFGAQNQTTSEVAIHTNLVSDLYAVLGDEHGSGAEHTAVLRLHRNPLAPWIWLGGLVMALGGALSLSDRRVRVGAPRRARLPAALPAE